MNSGEGKMTFSRPVINQSACAFYLCHIIKIHIFHILEVTSVSLAGCADSSMRFPRGGKPEEQYCPIPLHGQAFRPFSLRHIPLQQHTVMF